MRKREWADINKEIQKEMDKVCDEFLKGIGNFSDKQKQDPLQKATINQNERFERSVYSSDDLELALLRLNKLNNILELKLDMIGSGFTDS